MFERLRQERVGHRLDGSRIFLRPPMKSDYRQWQALRGESRAFLTPWEPSWSADELSTASFRLRMKSWQGDMQAGTAWTFFMFESASGSLAGGISVFNIRHGAAESGEIGYWSGEAFAGRGYMSEAIRLVIPFCFDLLGLRRLVAACIPDNKRSIRLLEKAGFAREGVLRSYLQINGERRDHLLFSLIAPERGETLHGG